MIWTCAGRSQQICSLSPKPLGHDYLNAKIIVVAIWDEAIYLFENFRYSKNKGSERIWTTDLSMCSRMLCHWATLLGMESSNYRMSSTHGSHFFTMNQVLTSIKAQGEDLEWFRMSSSKFNLTTPWRPLAIPKEKERFPRRVMTKIWYETAVNIRWIWD